METLKGMGLVIAFSAFFYKMSFLFGYLVGIVKGFLSYFCMLGVSGGAVQSASALLVNVGLIIAIYFVYQKFFK